MKKSSIVKATLCGAVALTIVATVRVPKSSSATLNAEKGLAGISITLDKYCATEAGSATDEILDSESKGNVVSGAAINEGAEFENMALSKANEYVNIRKEASTDSEIVGKLYRGAAADVVSINGEWIEVKSGSCKGFVSSEFMAVGLEAEELADQFGTKIATVNTTTLKVREKDNAESVCLTMVPNGEQYEVIGQKDGWVKISIDGGDIKGYVSSEYVSVEIKFEHAISIKEEEAAKAAEEAAKKAEEEAAAKAAEEEAARAAAAARASQSSTSSSNTSSSSSSTASSTSTSTRNSTSSSSSNSTSSSSSSSSSSSNSGSTVTSAGSGAEVASYALQFVGNPYVWGGTSLTNGADCSGFVMSVYSHFGISLPHSAASQAGYGKRVSLSEAKAGDLVFYARGGHINHVGMYIGGGQIVNAACAREGICIKSVNYRTVYCVKRIIG